MSSRNKTISIPSNDTSVKEINIDVKNLAKQFNLSQYDKVMEQGLRVLSRLDDKLLWSNCSDSEESTHRCGIVSLNLDDKFCNHEAKSNKTIPGKRHEVRRKVFKINNKRNLFKSDSYNNKIYKSWADRRNNSTEEKTDKLRQMMVNNTYQYDRQKTEFKIILPLHLKYFSVAKFQNPIRSCRFYEYVFPFVSEFYSEDSCVQQKSFETLQMFKRIYQTENSVKKRKIKYFLEDKDLIDVNKNNECITQTINYFQEWLESLNSAKAKFFRDALIQYMKSMNDYIDKTKESINTPSMENFNSETGVICNNFEKYWIKKLDKNTNKWIKTQAYTARTLKTNQEDDSSQLDSITLSYNMFNFLGINSNPRDHDTCFNIIEGLTRKIVTQFVQGLSEPDQDIPNIAKPDKIVNGFTITYGNKSRRIKSALIYYAEWVVNNCHYRRSYIIMNEPQPL